MSDSKGAVIDGILDEFEVVLHNDGPDDKAKRKAKQAILAILAQEVIDELKRVAAHNNSEYTSDYLEERIAELEANNAS